MPLKDYLSALRILILDADLDNDNSESRRRLLSKKLPALTATELADLLKIPAEKIDIYKRTVFGGESTIVQNHYKFSIAAIKQFFPEVYGESFDLIATIKQLHARVPWKSNQTLEFSANFYQFCLDTYGQIIEQQPYLAELLQYEFRMLNLRRAADSDSTLVFDLNRFSANQVSEILSKQIQTPTNSYLLKCHYNLLEIISFYRQSNLFPRQLPAEQYYFGLGRNQKKLPVSLKLDEFEFTLCTLQQFLTIEEYASAFLAINPEVDEVAAFQLALKRLQELLSFGILGILD